MKKSLKQIDRSLIQAHLNWISGMGQKALKFTLKSGENSGLFHESIKSEMMNEIRKRLVSA